MERHPRQIHVRMSEGEVKRAKALARSLDTTLSDLIRTLLQLPASSIEEGGSLVVIDRATAVKLAREMRRWGHHYNQGVHALNSIKFALDHGRGDLEWVSSKLDECALLLAQVDEGRCEMAGELASLEGRAIVGGD